MSNDPVIEHLGVQPYEKTWRAMREYTDHRTPDDTDLIWMVQHPPVYTLGQAGDPQHLLVNSDIPLVRTDRGGQITYHGPGQVIAYVMYDLRRTGMGVRQFVTYLEKAVIALLDGLSIKARANPKAPGVYVEAKKIAALGLRVRRGCSYHGISLNVKMDLTPFTQINPCGYADMEVTQIAAMKPDIGPNQIEQMLADQLIKSLKQ